MTKAMAETVSQSRFTEYCVTADDKEAILTESMRASQKLVSCSFDELLYSLILVSLWKR